MLHGGNAIIRTGNHFPRRHLRHPRRFASTSQPGDAHGWLLGIRIHGARVFTSRTCRDAECRPASRHRLPRVFVSFHNRLCGARGYRAWSRGRNGHRAQGQAQAAQAHAGAGRRGRRSRAGAGAGAGAGAWAWGRGMGGAGAGEGQGQGQGQAQGQGMGRAGAGAWAAQGGARGAGLRELPSAGRVTDTEQA